ncbi:MAG: TrpB-like pyridoxal phosphate-dependent enzyme [Candidatus Methanomethylicus sp.]|nr:TrpB-like pyridoxal phosphate-dependent enzyme [Candidatus Methanomethylicus sp.]
MTVFGKNTVRVDLPVDDIPKYWYNITPDLPITCPPPLDPITKKPAGPDAMWFFPKNIIMQEISCERFIQIPDEVRDAYVKMSRPTPIFRATRLEEYMKTPAEIYFKYEGISPLGSHKGNTAIAQAYYNKEEGIQGLVTETGAGQWGTALSLACSYFNMKCKVFMTRASHDQKPYRRVLMELYGAEVFASPSHETEFGKKTLAERPNHPGSLGVAISEAIETVRKDPTTKYSLGSVANHVLMHQTIIGQEAKMQLDLIDRKPDYVIGCVGGGSNYAGIAYPFIYEHLRGKLDATFYSVEPKAVPTFTRGVYTYDYGDTGGMTPIFPMYTVGHSFVTPPIHAGGLRYHGKAPTLSALVKAKVVTPLAVGQQDVFEAGRLFSKLEGIVPAPESAHALCSAMNVALECKAKNEKKVILFNMSGHGLLDLGGYGEFLGGRLSNNYEPKELALNDLPVEKEIR